MTLRRIYPFIKIYLGNIFNDSPLPHFRTPDLKQPDSIFAYLLLICTPSINPFFLVTWVLFGLKNSVFTKIYSCVGLCSQKIKIRKILQMFSVKWLNSSFTHPALLEFNSGQSNTILWTQNQRNQCLKLKTLIALSLTVGLF